ncbi:LamG domain-containing protein [Candidatus Poribacteria bacterium]|nr:LamG domain-containing protein [Candidatus Poribacteria bacterium]
MKTLAIIALVCFLLIETTAMADIKDGLILYFPLDDGKGTTVKDYSGKGRDGKIMDDNKVEWADGQKGFGKAFNFSGKGFGDQPKDQRTGRIEVQHDLGSPKALSVSLWFFATRDNDWNYFMDYRDPGSWFARDSGNKIQFNGQGGVESGQYPRNQWVHLVVLADSSSTKYYINGKLTGSQGGASNLNIGTKLHIGSRYSKNEAFLSILDDVAMWERIITESEIEQANQKPIISTTAVYPTGKLSTTWAEIKSE